MTAAPDIFVLSTPGELFRAAANEFVTRASEAIAKRGRFCVALSGGSTPKSLYSLLAENASLPWTKIYFFWSDERHVPPTDSESNYRMAQEALLAKVPVPPDHIFRVRAEEKDAEAAAREYEHAIAAFFALQTGELPRFDLILLGLGPDGHTASLFPGSAALKETERLVVANWVEKFKTYRITFTYPVLNSAACVMFLASGLEKAGMVHQILEDPSARLPAQGVLPENGQVLWMLDAAAASALQHLA
jgi:6-phosphogluconolactonase